MQSRLRRQVAVFQKCVRVFEPNPQSAPYFMEGDTTLKGMVGQLGELHGIDPYRTVTLARLNKMSRRQPTLKKEFQHMLRGTPYEFDSGLEVGPSALVPPDGTTAQPLQNLPEAGHLESGHGLQETDPDQPLEVGEWHVEELGGIPLRQGATELRRDLRLSASDQRADAFDKGVSAFKLFPHYARTGRLSMTQRTDRSMDSVFEEQVMAALQDRGYQVHPQVGIAGFFIDLAVADEQVPGKYILGIECDGAAYHDSRSARDRDRLRQAVLEDHGWAIYRIWSADWFQRPRAELERLATAIERAKADAASGVVGERAKRAVPVEVVTIERADVTEIGLQQVSFESSTLMYEEASLSPQRKTELHEAPISIVSELVKKTVEVEGPVHLDEVIARVRSAWGLLPAGNRIRSHVGHAIDVSVGGAHIHRSGEFLMWPGAEIRLRDRSTVSSAGLRRIEMIPPMEIDQGLMSVIGTGLGATEDEAVNAIARGLGFKSTSSQLRELIVSRIEVLKASGKLRIRDGMLVAADEVVPG